ncbi:DNA helicase [Burkholderia phage BCSR5]|nr:DNA helicase [Burkholderia phage BCSR5]
MARGNTAVSIIAREAFYIQRNKLSDKDYEALEKKFTHLYFEEKACRECEYMGDRKQAFPDVAETCSTCAGFKGGVKLATTVKMPIKTADGDRKNRKFVKLPAGNPRWVSSFLRKRGHDPEWNVKHPDVPMKRPILFTGTLKPEQKKAVKDVYEKERGVLTAPPRSGKTVMGSALACALNQKTMILASQRDWLVGFQETFIGSDTQKPLTNCRNKQIGFCKKLSDFEKYDVCLVTVQTFHSEKGLRLLRKIRDMFGLVIIDEVHTGAADKYMAALSRLNVRYMVGLSGTPDRKDGKYVIVEDVVGPIIHEIKTKRLAPVVELTRTNFVMKGRQGMWTTMVNKLEKDPQRLKLIAKTALKDVKAGHMVMIPLARIVPIEALVKAINIMAGKTIAKPFHGKVRKKDRDEYIQKARKYKIKVLVGQAKVMSTGINIPRASCLYEVTPSSNMPNAQQRMARVLTPMDDKPTPVIRYFLDEMGVRKKCMAAEYFGVLKPVFKAKISSANEKILLSYFKSRDQQFNYRPDF